MISTTWREAPEAGLVAGARGSSQLGQALARQLDDRAALGRLVLDRGDERGGDGLLLGHPGAAAIEAASRLP